MEYEEERIAIRIGQLAAKKEQELLTEAEHFTLQLWIRSSEKNLQTFRRVLASIDQRDSDAFEQSQTEQSLKKIMSKLSLKARNPHAIALLLGGIASLPILISYVFRLLPSGKRKRQ